MDLRHSAVPPEKSPEGLCYIGSMTVERLCDKGEAVVVIDNLGRGHRNSADGNVAFYRGNVGHRTLLARVTTEHGIHACVHLAT
jgi:UDP-glucose 4-epimerase